MKREMKNVDKQVLKDIAKNINSKVGNQKLPRSIKIRDDELVPYLVLGVSREELENCLRILAEAEVLEVLDINEETVKKPRDLLLPERTERHPVFHLKIKKNITEEDYTFIRCGKLILYTISGMAKYRKNAKYTTGTNQFIFLRHLMNQPNKRVSSELIAELLGFLWTPNEKNTSTKRRIYDLVRDIKQKLGIKEKDDVLIAENGYRLKCPPI